MGEDVGQDGPILTLRQPPGRIGGHHLPDVVEETSRRLIATQPRLWADERAPNFPFTLLAVTTRTPLLIHCLTPCGLVFGLVGASLGAALILFFSKAGLPAQNDVMTFFFSGSRLYPALEGKNVFIALAIVSFVSVLSCFYPAWIALRVTPRQAMSSEE